MASRITRLLGRNADEAAGAADEAAEVSDEAAEGVREVFAKALGETPGRVGEAAVSQPSRAAGEIGSGVKWLGGGAAAGGTALGTGIGYSSLQSRKEAEDLTESRQQSQENLSEILNNEDLPKDVRESALKRALKSGLFSPNLGGDPKNPDNVLDNVWFRRAVALIVAYYALKTINERYGG